MAKLNGSAANQVSPNGELGDMAFQSREGANIKRLDIEALLSAAIYEDSVATGANATVTGYLNPVIRLSNASLTSIDMIASPSRGKLIVLVNQTGVRITLNNDTGATAANRILTGIGANRSMADQSAFLMLYDETEQRWIILGGVGDVSSTSASSVDNTIATFDGTTGKFVQSNSPATLSDAGVIAGLTGLSSSGTTTFSGALNLSSNTNNTDTGSNVNIASVASNVIRLTSDSLLSVGGYAATTSGRLTVLMNTSLVSKLIIDEDTTVTATNRIRTGTGGSLLLAPNASILMIYNATTQRHQIIGGTGGGGTFYYTAIISDVKAAGTDAGTATSGSFATRTLNTLQDPFGIVTSLGSNQFVLPAGEYFIEASAPGNEVGRHKIKLRNITDSTDDIIGTSSGSNNGGAVDSRSFATGRLVLTGAKTFEVQHRVELTNASVGLGVASNFGVNEVYTTVKITKVVTSGSSSTIAATEPSEQSIANGAFDFWQEATSFAAVADATYTADMWVYNKSGAMVHTVSRSTDVAGSAKGTYAMLIDCTTVDASIAAGDYCAIENRMEGNVLRNIKGKNMVLAFTVKATKTGIHCVSFQNSALNRSLVKEYTVNATATHERKYIHFTLDSAGTWLYDTGIGLRIKWALAAGTTYQTTANTWQAGNFLATSNQVNACDSTSNDFIISDVVLMEDNSGLNKEPEFRYFDGSYTSESRLIKRYYEKSYNIDVAVGTVTSEGTTYGRVNNNGAYINLWFKSEKRVVPTMDFWNPATGANGTWTGGTPAVLNAGQVLVAINVPGSDNVAMNGHWTANARL